MEGDISKALTYQVKKEIAERYFGSRRQIEQDLQNARELVARARQQYETGVGPALVRIYALLMDEDLIDRFLQLVNWRHRPFFDSYVIQSESIRKRLVKDLHPHGWLAKTRFFNMLMDSYRTLYHEAEALDKLVNRAREEIEIIGEELRLFNRKYSLEEIMGFVRSLDFQGRDMARALGSNIDASNPEKLAEKLKLENAGNLAEDLPEIPDLPEPEAIHDALKELAAATFARHQDRAASAIKMAEGQNDSKQNR